MHRHGRINIFFIFGFSLFIWAITVIAQMGIKQGGWGWIIAIPAIVIVGPIVVIWTIMFFIWCGCAFRQFLVYMKWGNPPKGGGTWL